jgi:hypothetical protein
MNTNIASLALAATSVIAIATAASATPRASVVLDTGSYLVTVSKASSCQTHALNLKKSLKFNLGTDQRPEAIIHADGLVSDNLMHAMFCLQLPTPSKGTLLVSLAGETKVEAADDMTIVGVERVLETEAVSPLVAPASYEAGAYVFALQGAAGCRDAEINVSESLNYGPDRAITVQLVSSGIVVDDLIRTMECRFGTHSSASFYAVVGDGTAIQAMSGLEVVGVERVTVTEKVDLN